MGIEQEIIEKLEKNNISKPTQIQSDSYKHLVSGKDVIGCSQTGSGKTLAYLLPLYKLYNNCEKGVKVVIVVPTNELAMQIQRTVESLYITDEKSLTCANAIGDGNINRQIEAIKAKPDIVVGTAGRILKLIKLKKLPAHTVKTFIIDEADKMLDKTNIETIKNIRKCFMKYTQVVLFSATIDQRSITAASNILCTSQPVVLTIKNDDISKIPNTIKHYFIVTDRRERIETLRKLAKSINSSKTIIFINTKFDLEESLQKLQYHHYNADSLDGNKDKNSRKNAINNFSTGKLQYLIATDVAARGLQIDNIETVINVNLPEDPKEYQHRCGRCGRNGNTGMCISIVTENEIDKIKSYQKTFGINIVQKRLYQGKLVSK